MAIYSINRSGVEAMQNLKAELEQSINEILDITNRLNNVISGMENELGIYAGLINTEIKNVFYIMKRALEGDDGVGFLVNTKLPKMISDMERLIDAGLGDEEPPQKKKTLHR